VLIGFVGIPAGRVALPYLDQLTGDRAAVAAEESPAHVDALPVGFARSPNGEIGILWVHVVGAEDRPGPGLEIGRQGHE
jgi:hypothetical protein